MANDPLQRIMRRRNLKIIIFHLGIPRGKATNFIYPSRGTRNVYFDTVLANQDTATRFIEKIEYGMRFDWDKFMNIS
jgi:predicted TIM-barrel fold metal-dependent hydrolase